MERLHIHSTLQDLNLHTFVVRLDSLGSTVYKALEADPGLPGVVILSEEKTFCGAISRRRFFEVMSRPYGRELFLQRPISILQGFISQHCLTLSAETPIAEAAERAIARPTEFLYEPIVVECQEAAGATPYYLLDMHDVLQAQSIIHQLTADLLREKTRAERIQTEKMASLGKMMAGVAHEIRNPVNFIWGNLNYLEEYTEDLSVLVRSYEAEVPEPSQKLSKLRKKIDVDFVLKDLPKVLQSMTTGTDRLRKLVTSLRTFSRMDEMKRELTNIHYSLDGTLQILNNRIKLGIRIEKHYGEDVPEIPCYSGQVGQVFMNIISNAIDALLEYEASLATSDKGGRSPTLDPSTAHTWEPYIFIATAIAHTLPPDTPQYPAQSDLQGQSWVSIRIRDNGPGIPPEIQSKVFDDFFTTKPVGDGTGLGLPITLQIVKEKHGGHLILRSPAPVDNSRFETSGTEFEILLPTQISSEVASTTTPAYGEGNQSGGEAKRQVISGS